jgi:hypothetical protein
MYINSNNIHHPPSTILNSYPSLVQFSANTIFPHSKMHLSTILGTVLATASLASAAAAAQNLCSQAGSLGGALPLVTLKILSGVDNVAFVVKGGGTFNNNAVAACDNACSVQHT